MSLIVATEQCVDPGPSDQSAGSTLIAAFEARRCAVRDAIKQASCDLQQFVAETLESAKALDVYDPIALLMSSLSMMIDARFVSLLDRVPPIDVAEGWDRDQLQHRLSQLREEVRIQHLRIQRHRRQFDHLAAEYRRLRKFNFSIRSTLWAGLCRMIEDLKLKGHDTASAALVQRFSSEWPEPGGDLTEEELHAMLTLNDSVGSGGGLQMFAEEDVQVRIAEAVARTKAEEEAKYRRLERQMEDLNAEVPRRIQEAVALAATDVEHDRKMFSLLKQQYEAKIDQLQDVVDACHEEAENRLAHARQIRELQISGMSKNLEAVQGDVAKLKDFARQLEIDLARSQQSEESIKVELLEKTMAHKRELHAQLRIITELKAKLQAIPPREVIVAEATAPFIEKVEQLQRAVADGDMKLISLRQQHEGLTLEAETAHFDVGRLSKVVDELKAANRGFEEELFRAQQTINELREERLNRVSEMEVLQNKVTWQGEQIVEMRKLLNIAPGQGFLPSTTGSAAAVSQQSRSGLHPGQNQQQQQPSTRRTGSTATTRVTTAGEKAPNSGPRKQQQLPVRVAVDVGSQTDPAHSRFVETAVQCTFGPVGEKSPVQRLRDHDRHKPVLDVGSMEEPHDMMPMPAAAYRVTANLTASRTRHRSPSSQRRLSDGAAAAGIQPHPRFPGVVRRHTIGDPSFDGASHGSSLTDPSSVFALRLHEEGVVGSESDPLGRATPEVAIVGDEGRGMHETSTAGDSARASLGWPQLRALPTVEAVVNDPVGESTANDKVDFSVSLMRQAAAEETRGHHSVLQLTPEGSGSKFGEVEPIATNHDADQQIQHVAQLDSTFALQGVTLGIKVPTPACGRDGDTEGRFSVVSHSGLSHATAHIGEVATDRRLIGGLDGHSMVGTSATRNATGKGVTTASGASSLGLIGLISQLRAAQQLQEMYRARLAQDTMALNGVAAASVTRKQTDGELAPTCSAATQTQFFVSNHSRDGDDNRPDRHRQLCTENTKRVLGDAFAALANCADCQLCSHHCRLLCFADDIQHALEAIVTDPRAHSLAARGGPATFTSSISGVASDGPQSIALAATTVPIRPHSSSISRSSRNQSVPIPASSLTSASIPAERSRLLPAAHLSLVPENYFQAKDAVSSRAQGCSPRGPVPPSSPSGGGIAGRKGISVVQWRTQAKASGLV